MVVLVGNAPIRAESSGTIPADPTGDGDGTACAVPAYARYAVVAAMLTSPAVALRTFSHLGRPRVRE